MDPLDADASSPGVDVVVPKVQDTSPFRRRVNNHIGEADPLEVFDTSDFYDPGELPEVVSVDGDHDLDTLEETQDGGGDIDPFSDDSDSEFDTLLDPDQNDSPLDFRVTGRAVYLERFLSRQNIDKTAEAVLSNVDSKGKTEKEDALISQFYSKELLAHGIPCFFKLTRSKWLRAEFLLQRKNAVDRMNKFRRERGLLLLERFLASKNIFHSAAETLAAGGAKSKMGIPDEEINRFYLSELRTRNILYPDSRVTKKFWPEIEDILQTHEETLSLEKILAHRATPAKEPGASEKDSWVTIRGFDWNSLNKDPRYTINEFLQLLYRS